MKVECRDNGDVVLYAVNGDPLLKLQLSEPAVMVNELVMVKGKARNHPLDCRAEILTEEAVRAVREFCERADARNE